MATWRTAIVQGVADRLVAWGMDDIKAVAVWNKDVEEGLAQGKLPRPPFCFVRYNGWDGEQLGRAQRRRVRLAVIVGADCAKGDATSYGRASVYLELIDEALNGWIPPTTYGEGLTMVTAPASPFEVAAEEYLGRVGNVEVWGMEIALSIVVSPDADVNVPIVEEEPEEPEGEGEGE